MFEKTGKTLEKKQIKNKWDNMKKEWTLYDRLMRLKTGIGGSPEWWESDVDKDFAKFKGANLDIFDTHYAPFFRDSVAVGDQTMTLLQFQNESNMSGVRSEENIEGKGDSDEISDGADETLFPSCSESSSTKTKKSKDVANKRSTKSKTKFFEDKLDVVIGALMDSDDSDSYDDEDNLVDEDIELKRLCGIVV
ncbi:hypothetical protein QVD17_30120 [Tagetes erecta]|uniref:Myb/SANT-like domain-containing protein n=1 Tax=Tagetes erecta TaxID=13708 RepID=A0AAD8NMZ6_TARER|nr:hypothetical protein QVD17_30120 [Tagetes erecta]